MRRLALIFALVACSAWAAPAFVQGAQATTTSLAFTSANAAGNLLVCAVENNAYVGPLSVSDSAGNTWTSAVGPKTDSSGQAVQIFYAPNSKAGANTVTVAGSGGNYVNVVIAEYSGVATTAPVRGTGGAANGSSTTADTGSFASTSGDLVVAMGMMSQGGTTVGAGYTSRGTDGFSMMEDQIAASSTVNATLTGSDHPWAIVGIPFKPSGAAAAMAPRHGASICCRP